MASKYLEYSTSTHLNATMARPQKRARFSSPTRADSNLHRDQPGFQAPRRRKRRRGEDQIFPRHTPDPELHAPHNFPAASGSPGLSPAESIVNDQPPPGDDIVLNIQIKMPPRSTEVEASKMARDISSAAFNMRFDAGGLPSLSISQQRRFQYSPAIGRHN